MKIDNDAKLRLLCENGLEIKDISAFFEYNGEHYDILKEENGTWTIEKISSSQIRLFDGRFEIIFTEKANGVSVRGGYTPTQDIVAASGLYFFKGRINGRFKKVLSNGATLFSGVPVNDMQAETKVSYLAKNECKHSTDFSVAELDSGRGLAVGAVTFEENFACVELNENGSAICGIPLEGKAIRAGEKVVSDEFMLLDGENLVEALKKYYAHIYEGRRIDRGPALSGWCSWYYYGDKISEDIILENLRELKARQAPVEVIQIDDGWSISRGDWEANERFPMGMKALADTIRAEGFLPGIWVAPFTASASSALVKNHPEFFVKNLGDEGIYPSYPLDFSHEGACKFLYDLFHKLTHEWGFRYIKFDFVLFGISNGRHCVPAYNGIKNYHKALEIIRSAVAEGTVLLACTAPLASSIGKVQGLRVSKDIFERWISLKEVAAQTLSRIYMNEYIRIDPDCLLLRSSANEDGECFRLCTRTEKENETFATLVGVCGGATMLSDKVKLLTDEQLDKFKALLPVNERAGTPVDFGENVIPSIVDCGERKGVRTVALFNWEDYPEEVSFTLGEKYKVYDFWEKVFLPERTETLCFTIPPHQCKVLQCSKRESELLGCMHRLVPNVRVQYRENSITLDHLKKGETLLFSFRKKVENLKNCTIKPLGDGIYAVTATQSRLEIFFAE